MEGNSMVGERIETFHHVLFCTFWIWSKMNILLSQTLKCKLSLFLLNIFEKSTLYNEIIYIISMHYYDFNQKPYSIFLFQLSRIAKYAILGKFNFWLIRMLIVETLGFKMYVTSENISKMCFFFLSQERCMASWT